MNTQPTAKLRPESAAATHTASQGERIGAVALQHVGQNADLSDEQQLLDDGVCYFSSGAAQELGRRWGTAA